MRTLGACALRACKSVRYLPSTKHSVLSVCHINKAQANCLPVALLACIVCGKPLAAHQNQSLLKSYFHMLAKAPCRIIRTRWERLCSMGVIILECIQIDVKTLFIPHTYSFLTHARCSAHGGQEASQPARHGMPVAHTVGQQSLPTRALLLVRAHTHTCMLAPCIYACKNG
jgi:hypothetical protein